ncbi:MAG: aminotransferase class V-fold PLP-dependent enzyme, partial [Acidobacteria bacterium]|nr:aminotransferase class V-fold PLP-dependent enzyme [Acidobacteriota bacterium]
MAFLSRRRFLAASGALAGAPVLTGVPPSAPAPRADHIYSRLGVRTFINAKGTYTALSGSLMPEDVVRSMEEAAQHFVAIEELQRAVGEKIARLLGAEAACVTSGAAAAILLGTAACVASNEPEKIKRLPDLTGMKNEVILQKKHRVSYDHAMRNVGVRLVEVETAEELERAINPATAMLFFLNRAQNEGAIGPAPWVEVGKRRGVPTFNDAAADTPPLSRLSEYARLGFDLVAFSGGKALRGPQCSGLLFGRRDLVEAALANGSPHSDTIGRPAKVGKEEIVGLYVALERYLTLDHQAEWKDWEKRIAAMKEILAAAPGVETGVFIPQIANQVPHLYLRWDEKAKGLTKPDVGRSLREGQPSIECLV